MKILIEYHPQYLSSQIQLTFLTQNSAINGVSNIFITNENESNTNNMEKNFSPKSYKSDTVNNNTINNNYTELQSVKKKFKNLKIKYNILNNFYDKDIQKLKQNNNMNQGRLKNEINNGYCLHK